MKEISVHDFKQVLATSTADSSVDFINVCSPAEYKEQHIEGVRNVPLDTLADRAGEFAGKEHVYVHCRSGKRGMKAIEMLKELGVKAELINVSGGIMSWDEAGLPTKSVTNRLPIMRQVFLTAGMVVLASVLLGYLVHEVWYLMALFVGSGLSFAGVTGWCGMSKVLAVMPWNK